MIVGSENFIFTMRHTYSIILSVYKKYIHFIFMFIVASLIIIVLANQIENAFISFEKVLFFEKNTVESFYFLQIKKIH